MATINWQISGEAGKSLDETQRTFPSWKAKNVNLTVGNLEDDKLRFVQSFKDPAEAAIYGIDEGQKVEVWRDAVRVFSGIVAKKRVKENVQSVMTVTVEVAGAWWWMRNTSLSGDMTDAAGGVAERLKFVLGEGMLDAHIGTVIDRAIALGVPIQKGTIAPCFTVPQISITNQSCANALAELLRWVPDATAWFDYSGVGDPLLNISRRSTATIFTLTAGVDGELQGYDLQPRLDLKVDEVKINYVQRDVQWRTTFEEQTSGVSTAGRPGRQIVTISGPELGDFLPRDEYDSYVSSSTSSVETYALTQSIFAAAVDAGLTNQLFFSDYDQIWRMQYKPGTFSNKPMTSRVAGISCLDTDGNPYSRSGKVFLLGPTPPQWLIDQLNLTEVNLSSGWSYKHARQYGSGSLIDPPAWVSKLGGSITDTGWLGTEQIFWHIWSGVFSAKAWMAPSIPSGTIYRDADFGFIFPPADLADNLLAAQNWTPYEGSVALKHAEALGQTHIGQVLNLAGALPEYAAMKAPIQRVDYGIDSGDTSITVGAPARMSIAGLVQRFRRNPQDNIVFLG